jgi:hypothetical protein
MNLKKVLEHVCLVLYHICQTLTLLLKVTSVHFTSSPNEFRIFSMNTSHVSYSNFSSILLNNTVTPMIIQHQAMSYLSVPILTSSSLTDVAKLPKYLLKSAFYDNFIYFRCGSKIFITIQIKDNNSDDLRLECFDIFA